MARTTSAGYPFAKVHSCKIHPGIGIARVGNSTEGYYLAPESLEASKDAPTGGYKDASGRVKRQAARFKLYGYDKDGINLGELPLRPTENDRSAVEVEWGVHLVNKKGACYRVQDGLPRTPNAKLRNGNGASHHYPDTRDPNERSELIIDPNVRTIASSGKPASSRFDTGKFLGFEVNLGELQIDETGRLLVLGGLGHAASTIPDNPIGADPNSADYWANNDYWYDDVSDGPVTATVTLPDGRRIEVSDPRDAAWVVVGPPQFCAINRCARHLVRCDT
ncbi:LodA/GoxA family CTQ-dependent oxidase [Bradyrhizobium uaiense]|uniref:L-Lysine epsilon oxidase N-terminal domain-containing protein n=1 Tax=Bradyrhizobium uaiense TaxID=2594946 RepID=A0A6P1BJH9_9BRAD|nr:LodA/GoxA family CTQ-dependent oxidase [Bradyrhizobium uaiense]NEU98324.1 hypothetical protein [Bradyrhizobium uaiense]